MTTLVNTSTSDHEKHGKVQQHWRQKRKKHMYAYNELQVTVIYPTANHVKH